MRPKARPVLIDGVSYTCPMRVQRLKLVTGPGWQTRYGLTKYFPDGEDGPAKSLRAAIKHLNAQYREKPPEPVTSVRTTPLAHKTSTLPAGISGPIVRLRPGRPAEFAYGVSLPRKGRPSGNTSVYIGTENTYTEERDEKALAKAMAIRAAAVKAWGRLRATKAPAGKPAPRG